MTQKFEQMSAVMDGESNVDSLQVNDDAELSNAWNRYHVVRSVMRKEMPEGAYMDVSASIAAALESEPAILAPNASSSSTLFSKLSSKVIPFARQSGQFAVAASVAAAVIIGVQTYNQPEANEPFATAITTTPQGGLAPVSLNQTRVLPSESKQDLMETRRQIQALITDHEQQVKLKASVQKLSEETDEDVSSK